MAGEFVLIPGGLLFILIGLLVYIERNHYKDTGIFNPLLINIKREEDKKRFNLLIAFGAIGIIVYLIVGIILTTLGLYLVFVN